MRNTTFWLLMAGFACVIMGTILTERDRRRRDSNVAEDIEEQLRASNIHWLYCSDCERWWHTCRAYCRKCESELEAPAKEVLVEFTTELVAFWKALARESARRGYRVRRAYTENEIAGLLWVKKRHEARQAMEREGKA